MEQQAKKRFLIDFLYLLVIGGITVLAGRFLLLRMFPFLLSIIVATLSQKPAAFISKKVGIKKSFWAVVLSVCIYLGACGILVFLIWRLIISSLDLIDYLPDVFSKLNVLTTDIENWLSDYMTEDFNISLSSVFGKILNGITDYVTSIVKQVMTSAPSFLLSSVVALVATCYIAKDYDGLVKFVKSLCSVETIRKAQNIKAILVNSVLKILRGYLILMLITFVELWLGFSILRINNAYLWAFIIALVDFMPILGTGAVMIPWALYCALTGSPGLAGGLALIYIIVVLVRNFAEPKIVSHQVGINPLFTLLSMYLGLKLFGGTGLLLFPIILIVTVKYYKEYD